MHLLVMAVVNKEQDNPDWFVLFCFWAEKSPWNRVPMSRLWNCWQTLVKWKWMGVTMNLPLEEQFIKWRVTMDTEWRTRGWEIMSWSKLRDWYGKYDFDGSEEPENGRKMWPKILNFQLKTKKTNKHTPYGDHKGKGRLQWLKSERPNFVFSL